VITCGRAIHGQAMTAGYVAALETFGVQFVTDTCWCMLGEPVVPVGARTLMTNSGKYAHYAPGLVGRLVHFGSLAACVAAACAGETSGRLPRWLDSAVEVTAHV
jgi:predicted aconitase